MSEEIQALPQIKKPATFIGKYVFSRDHKIIGLQYFFLALAAALAGTLMSLLIRLRLAWPQERWPLLEMIFPNGFSDGLMKPEFYLAMVTMHGTMMVFMVLSVAPQSAFGNYFLPIQIGAREMVFPRLNMLSFWLTFASFVVLIAALFVAGGAPIGGWTFYPPLSAIASAGPGQGAGADLWLVSIGVFCLAAFLGSINFIVTTLTRRTKGMSLMRMPLTCWGWFTTACISLLAFPVLLVAGLLLFLDRNFGMSFFKPAGLVVTGQVIEGGGGSPLLWQHLFWFFGHPEVYLVIIPVMGVISHVMATFARKPVFGHRAMVTAMLAIGALGFLIWGHHMFVSGMNPRLGLAFSVLTLVIGVPSAVKTFNWLGTLWGARIRFTTPMLFAIGFVSLFVSGGVTGLVLGQMALDMVFHDTYFVTGHFHMVMGVAAVFGIFAATYYWFPKMFGRMMNETMGKLHFWLTFAGVYAIFVPFHLLGIAGHPRRYADTLWFDFLKPLEPLHIFITIAAFVTAAAQLIFAGNFLLSLRKGARAGDNPWEATTLEWTVATPPPMENFAGRLPVVHRGPYEYSTPGAAKDYSMQTESLD
ncbi:MAG: Alternative cytochrome c oxidase subunit 1 [Acidobacteria bacterium]|nr:Alternative cytochrome c oxidase subunit 1 [Acidobacteriota bacterium]